MFLSIIIPVYKVEKYVASTLNSVYGQGFDEDLFEVVVVDDGTPDDSMKVVESFSMEHGNLRIIHQANQGLSGARNTGFEASQGDYVWWIDSDDLVTPESFGLIHATITQHPERDLYGFGICTVDEATGEKRHFSPLSKSPVANPYGRDIDYSVMQNHTYGPVARYVFNSGFLRKVGLSFWKGILHEDIDFLNKAYFFAQRIWLQEEDIYHYLERAGGSIMSTIRLKTFEDLLQICRSFDHLRLEHQNDPKAWRYWSGCMWRVLTIMMRPQMRGHGLRTEDRPAYDLLMNDNSAYFRSIAWRALPVCLAYHDWKDAVKAVLVGLGLKTRF